MRPALDPITLAAGNGLRGRLSATHQDYIPYPPPAGDQTSVAMGARAEERRPALPPHTGTHWTFDAFAPLVARLPAEDRAFAEDSLRALESPRGRALVTGQFSAGRGLTESVRCDSTEGKQLPRVRWLT